jgi:3',5'-cyclic AMP phosphodiesterase CpdA
MLPRQAWAAERPVDANRWALLADTHIWEQRDGSHNGTKPADNLAQALAEILTLDPRPAGVIFAGDTVFLDGHAADYAVFRHLVQPVREAGIPLHIALGNHDHRANFWAAFPESKPLHPLAAEHHVAVVETPHANWFLLDSLEKTHVTPGLLGKPQLKWLAGALDARPDKPAILVAHHDLGIPHGLRDVAALLVSSGLRDAPALMEVAAARKQVRAYFYGHTHEWHVDKQRAVHLVNVPATAWLFDPKQPRGWLDVRFSDRGATLVLHALDKKHPKHAQQVDLTWQA